MDAKTGTSADAYEQLPAQRSPAAVKMDNLMRRVLRVSNPYDAGDVAAGLARLYRDSAQTLQLEEQGLPFLRMPVVPAAPASGESPSGVEMHQARTDIQRDIDSLINNALLKDIQPELRGWQSAIESLVEEGSQAARFGLDPRQRDRTFAIRRTLGDYARASRFVGALTPSLNLDYRRFAQSLDEVSSMLLVILGDSLARVGFGSGRFLLQAPASELQERREAVLNALRHLLGLVTADQATQEDWPRATHAYRVLLRRLDSSGNSDLRALFQESYLSQFMDQLIARAATPSADGLRALGSTAALAVQQLRRMILITGRLVDPDSPPLKYFLVSLQLFYEAFESTTSGFRLLFISRPIISFYGLYGLGGPDDATLRLQQLILGRSTLAQLLDCYLACDCNADRVRYQILFDKMLYDLDRAIDFYALGSDPQGQGEPEARAATFGLIGQELRDHVTDPAAPPLLDLVAALPQIVRDLFSPGEIANVQARLINSAAIAPAAPPLLDLRAELLESEMDRFSPGEIAVVQARLDNSAPAIAPAVRSNTGILWNLRGLVRPVDPTHVDVVRQIDVVIGHLLSGIGVVPGQPPLAASVQSDHARARNMLQELCLQRDLEQQWTALLRTMTPSCQPPEDLRDLVLGVLDATRIRYFGRLECAPIDVSIPPTRATSGAGDTYGEFSEGGIGE